MNKGTHKPWRRRQTLLPRSRSAQEIINEISIMLLAMDGMQYLSLQRAPGAIDTGKIYFNYADVAIIDLQQRLATIAANIEEGRIHVKP